MKTKGQWQWGHRMTAPFFVRTTPVQPTATWPCPLASGSRGVRSAPRNQGDNRNNPSIVRERGVKRTPLNPRGRAECNTAVMGGFCRCSPLLLQLMAHEGDRVSECRPGWARGISKSPHCSPAPDSAAAAPASKITSFNMKTVKYGANVFLVP